MKRMVLRMRLFCISCAIVSFSVFPLIDNLYLAGSIKSYLVIVALVMDSMLAISLFFMFVWQYINYKRGLLIIENELFKMPAVSADDDRDNVGIYLSSFGILLEDRVIPFKVKDKKLIGLKLEGKLLKIVYDKKGKQKNIEIYTCLEEAEQLKKLQDRLYFETGVYLNISPPLGDTFFGEQSYN